MYSILLLQSNKSYLYATNTDGTRFAGDLAATQEKVRELMDKYPVGSISVVHNTTLTATIEIIDVMSE